MGYLTAKQFSNIWGITERRIIKLCKEGRISGAIKDGMVWEIPEETLKPSDKRSNIYKYINIEKRIMVVNVEEKIKNYLLELIEKEGYTVEFKDYNWLKDNLKNVSQYYEGLIYFRGDSIAKNEEIFITNFSSKLHSEASIVIVDYKTSRRNEIERKLANKLKDEIGLRINTLVLDIPKDKDVLINYTEIAEDINNNGTINVLI